jgi:FkbM family methyltransferase
MVGKRAVRSGLARAGLTVERLPLRGGLAHHLVTLLARLDADCVIDVGANRGQFGSLLREAGYGGTIISFEPVSEAYRDLGATARPDANWAVRRLALADEPGTQALNVAVSSSVSSFLPATEHYASSYSGAQVKRTEDVKVETLDGLAAELPYRRMFLKIDTQGYDLKVLQGARRLLERNVIGVQIELSAIHIYEGMPDHIDAMQALRDLGFVPSGLFPLAVDDRMRAWEIDGVFVRA